MFHEQEGCPVASLFRLLDLSRSSCYYQQVKREENKLREAIEAVAAEFATYGNRRVTKELRRPPYKMRIKSQAYSTFDAGDGPSAGPEAPQTPHHQQPTRISTLSQSGD